MLNSKTVRTFQAVQALICVWIIILLQDERCRGLQHISEQWSATSSWSGCAQFGRCRCPSPRQTPSALKIPPACFTDGWTHWYHFLPCLSTIGRFCHQSQTSSVNKSFFFPVILKCVVKCIHWCVALFLLLRSGAETATCPLGPLQDVLLLTLLLLILVPCALFRNSCDCEEVAF